MKTHDTKNEPEDNNDASTATVVAAVSAAAIALSYSRPAHAVAIVDDIAIAIANAAAKMYLIATNALMDTWYNKDVKKAETAAQSWATMGDAYMEVKTTISAKINSISALESIENCRLRYKSEGRKADLEGAVNSQKKLTQTGNKDASVNQVSVALNISNKSKGVIPSEVTNYLGASNSPGVTMSKIFSSTRASFEPYAHKLTQADKQNLMYRNALLATYPEGGVQATIDAISAVKVGAVTSTTQSEMFRDIPVKLTHTSVLAYGQSYGLDLASSSTGTSSFSASSPLMSEAKTRSRNLDMLTSLKDTPNEISSLMETYYATGLEISTYLEMYRTNEVMILTLVTQLLNDMQAGKAS